ncbi:hypothetical protein CLAFUW4_13789 [Fulvia fulva]|uniref:Uncharacterized protein n=1 Tax=Passalora fulva TaxID=5499 RepID=A0A9Q8PLK4_PASFU|nr:uncharacterized protein CLAFUR5_13635 [Fulvia fulva]KAK4610513.1 hypothetical protein CLAFUR4_13792 [Fulvia fulva]KAK4610948.1 hypothetical protein CLAFUR0_13796 [Fulvia fulva]UJO24662.1 hypothetical protein CLAFUR5_13635 [Fulvia fulva]WPV21714.1 hypothetical protein CLAFUW4_13789 [Fulvia fulva]WPV36992.1 hypothetical protein CLAFUW7_13797 [Fulvia fulva]
MPSRHRYFTAAHAASYEQAHNLLEGSVAAGYLAHFGATEAAIALEALLKDPPLLTGPDGTPRWATNPKEQDIVDEYRAEGFQDSKGNWHPPLSPINVPSPRSKVKRRNAVKDKSGTGAQGVAGKSGVQRSGAVRGHRGPGGQGGGRVEKKSGSKSKVKRGSKERKDSVVDTWFGGGRINADFTTGHALRSSPRRQRGSV